MDHLIADTLQFLHQHRYGSPTVPHGARRVRPWITHCAPDSVQDELSGGKYLHDKLTGFLEEIKNKTKYHYWLHGHYHGNKNIGDNFVMLYEQIVQVI